MMRCLTGIVGEEAGLEKHNMVLQMYGSLVETPYFHNNLGLVDSRLPFPRHSSAPRP